MKRLLWIGGIVVAVIVIVVVVLTLVVRNYLKSENLKALIIPKIEETTGREVNIKAINVSLFKGIVVRGIAIKSPDKKESTLEVERFILNYSLLPLLKKQLVIKEIRLESPHILVRRNKDGVFSIEDIFRHKKRKRAVRKKEQVEEAFSLPVSIVTDRVIVNDAQMRFIDEQKTLPDVEGISDMEFKVSLKDLTEIPEVKGALNIKKLSLFINGREIKTTGRIDIDRKNIDFLLETLLEGDRVMVQGRVADYLSRPDIENNIYSKHLDLERLIAIIPSKKEEKKGEGAESTSSKKPPTKAGRTVPINITAHGEIKVDVARYRGYDIRNFFLKYRYQNEIFTINPLRCEITGGEVVNAQGSAEGEFSLKYSTSSDDPLALAKKTLRGTLTARLTKGEIKKSKISDAIVTFTGLEELRRLTFRDALFRFNFADERIGITGYMNSDYIKIIPRGVVDFDQKADLKAEIKVAPSLTDNLARNIRIPDLFTDDKGWTIIPLKIAGKMSDPSVSLDPAGIKKEIRKKIKKKVEEEIMKILSPATEGQDSTPVQEILKGIFGQ